MKVLFAGVDPDPLVMSNSGEDRKAGVHLSDITKRMAYERDRKYHPDSPIDMMVLERGFTWETILESSLSHRHRRPGFRPEQFQEDGIWCSPDWVDPDADVQLEEWKATKKSMKRGFEDISWGWMPNSMAYLRGLLRRRIVRTPTIRFRIWWINGDYSYESKTSDFHLLNEYWRVDVAFTSRELDENWRSIVTHGQKYGLLPVEDKTWPRPTLEATIRRRQSEAGKAPARSPRTARVATFPTTKGSRPHRNAS